MLFQVSKCQPVDDGSRRARDGGRAGTNRGRVKAVEPVVREFFAGGGVLPHIELSLGKADADAFPPLIQNQKTNQFLTDSVIRLAGNDRGFLTQDAASVNDNEMIGGQAAFPNF